jgi:hypothetical protein
MCRAKRIGLFYLATATRKLLLQKGIPINYILKPLKDTKLDVVFNDQAEV